MKAEEDRPARTAARAVEAVGEPDQYGIPTQEALERALLRQTLWEARAALAQIKLLHEVSRVGPGPGPGRDDAAADPDWLADQAWQVEVHRRVIHLAEELLADGGQIPDPSGSVRWVADYPLASLRPSGRGLGNGA